MERDRVTWAEVALEHGTIVIIALATTAMFIAASVSGSCKAPTQQQESTDAE